MNVAPSVPASRKIRPRMALAAGAASLVTVIILIVIKSIASLHSGSASVTASLIDSIVDASVSLMTFMAIHVSLKPADIDHRHGHGKVEGLVALMQAAFIAGAAVFLLLESVRRFSMGHTVGAYREAIIIMAVSTILSVVLVLIQRYSLKYAPSLAVKADQVHYKTDIFVNLGVIGVIVALSYGAPRWIDPVFSGCVALFLGFTVWAVSRQAIDMLLDRELPGNVRETITKKVLSTRYVLGLHDLRTSKSGMRIFISFDIELDPSLLLYHAHEIAREVEHVLLAEFPNAEIMIHVDPHGDTDDSRHQVAGVHH